MTPENALALEENATALIAAVIVFIPYYVHPPETFVSLWVTLLVGLVFAVPLLDAYWYLRGYGGYSIFAKLLTP